MQIEVNFLENLKLEAKFDDFTVLTDQPVRYKGDGLAPSPFDFFLSSSALCAAYFAKVYCKARNIPTEDIRVSQNNIIDPENRYKQTFHIKIELPESLSEKDRKGILRSMERCTVKKVIQQGPEFIIEAVTSLGIDNTIRDMFLAEDEKQTMIPGKDLALEQTIANMMSVLDEIGINIEIASWRNLVSNVWSVHIRDSDSPICFTNGKGSSKESALCSALGEYIERISTNYFYNDYYLGKDLAQREFVHYPNERWFELPSDDSLPEGLMDDALRKIYDPDEELNASHLVDTNSGRPERGVCAIPFVRDSDKEVVYIPVNLVGNLFVSNGMSAGNTIEEAHVQCLSEIFERAVKKQIIEEELVLPDVPKYVLDRYPKIAAGIKELESKGFPILVKDASLGGQFPVMCVTLMNPKTGGVYASFGAHPKFEIALERSLTELLQGRSFEGLNDMPPPTFNKEAITEPNNFIEHFIDSTGVISWRFFSNKSDYQFCDWNFEGTTAEENQYLMDILRKMGKEVYIADYKDLGSNACRILVPQYSEIYPIDDLIWDNHNRAIEFRQDILGIHSLSNQQLDELVNRLEESGLDNYMKISELIGIEFEETSVWGLLDLGELKLLIYLALQKYEEAKELIQGFLLFNENTVERRMFYRGIDAAINIVMDPNLELADFRENLSRMFGEKIMDIIENSVNGTIKFYGLTPTNDRFDGLEKHQKMIESYHKLHMARSINTPRSNDY